MMLLMTPISVLTVKTELRSMASWGKNEDVYDTPAYVFWYRLFHWNLQRPCNVKGGSWVTILQD